MSAYLIDHPPRIAQFRARTRPINGVTVIHTAEGVMDTVGPDTGAENVARFIQQRTTYGSYHDLADSDSWIRLVPLELAAFQDGTGTNDTALSLSFACATHHWPVMTPARRRAFFRQGAKAFAAQQRWKAVRGLPTTPLRRITKAQSDAGIGGCVAHGDRDPGRRTDPGIVPPDLFPWDEFFEECRAELAGGPTKEWDEMASKDEIKQAVREVLKEEGPDSPADYLAQRARVIQRDADPEHSIGTIARTVRAIKGGVDQLLSREQPPAA